MKKIKQKITNIKEKIKEKWQNLSKRDKIILAILLIILPSFIYFKFYFFSEKSKLKKLQKERKKLELKLSSLNRKKIDLKKIEKKLIKKELILKKTQKLLPTKDEIPELINNVSEEATKAGLNILLFKPQKERKTDYYAIIPIQIKAEGSFHQIMFFINSLRKLERIVNLKRLVIIKKRKRRGKGEFIEDKLKAECFLEIYRFLTKQERDELQKAKKRKKKRR